VRDLGEGGEMDSFFKVLIYHSPEERKFGSEIYLNNI
jgi:hypothetical protein